MTARSPVILAGVVAATLGCSRSETATRNVSVVASTTSSGELAAGARTGDAGPMPSASMAPLLPDAAPQGRLAPAVWSHDGKRVATARGGRLLFLEVETGASVAAAHPAPVAAIVWSPDDTIVGVAVADGIDETNPWPTIVAHELWRTTRAELVAPLPPPGLGIVGDRAAPPTFASAAPKVAFVTEALGLPTSVTYPDRPALGVIDVATGETLYRVRVQPPERGWEWDRVGPPWPRAIVPSADGATVAVRWSDSDLPITLADVNARHDEAIGPRSVTCDPAWSADGKWLAWCTMFGVARRDAKTRKLGSPFTTGDRWPTELAMHPSRAELLVLTEESASGWDLTTGRRRWQIPLTSGCFLERREAAYVDAGAHVLVQACDGYLLLDGATGAVLTSRGAGSDAAAERGLEAERLHGGAWVDDGGALHTRDGTGHDHVIGHVDAYKERPALARSPDGRRVLVSGDPSGAIRVIDIESGVVRSLSEGR